MAEKQAEVSEN